MGVVEKVDVKPLKTLLDAGYIPIISSIGINSNLAEKLDSYLLNVNADIAAGEIAAALKAEKLIFLTDIAGICDKEGKVISKLNATEAENLITSKVAVSGMIPKIRAGIRALDSAAEVRIVDGRRPHALLEEIRRSEGGTTINNLK